MGLDALKLQIQPKDARILCKALVSFCFFSRCDGGEEGRGKRTVIALEGGKFSIRGITQVCCDAQTGKDRLARPQLQLSHRAQRRETPLIPLCNPCLILPEKSSKSTGSPANTSRQGEIPLVLLGGKNDICEASAEVQRG